MRFPYAGITHTIHIQLLILILKSFLLLILVQSLASPSTWLLTSCISAAQSSLWSVTGDSPSTLMHHGVRYHQRSGMPVGSRHLGASSSHTLEFASSPASAYREVVPELLFHYCWSFLDHNSLVNLCRACPILSTYGNLRHKASILSTSAIRNILKPLDHSVRTTTICNKRATSVGLLLILCNFNTGLLIRCLNGNYVGSFLNYKAIDSCLAALATIPQNPKEPPQNFELLHKLFHENVPFVSNFKCKRADMLTRHLYNNHRAADPHLSSILAKTAQDTQNSYTIALPRWTIRFVGGLFLAALGYATREVKGRIKGRPVNDPTALISGESDSGALNLHIPRDDPNKMPPVYYQTALSRLWSRIYNLRIAHPSDDIIIYKDDLVSAFRRLRYHPDVAAAYSFVVDNFLLLPIGMVFGARDAPSLFCLLSELRSFASRHLHLLPLHKPLTSMIDSVSFQHSTPPPSSLTPAHADFFNKGIDGSTPGHQPTFVDDTIMAELRSVIRCAASNSVFTAALFVGHSDLVEEPISLEKFEKFFSHLNETLGFLTNSRDMTASYPADKKESLSSLLHSSTWPPRSKHPIRLLARILGKVRHVAQILPFGSHLSIHLQLCLSKHVMSRLKRSPSSTPLKSRLKSAWNPHSSVHISRAAAQDLRHLRSILSTDNSLLWTRPLSLLVEKEPHFLGESDASNTAMGGISRDLQFQWRLSNSAFSNLPPWIVVPEGAPSWHINVHEFIAIIINGFFMMFAFLHISSSTPTLLPQTDGFIFRLQADNTSALSWMRHLSRTRDAHLTQLCHLFSHLIFTFNSSVPSRFDGKHLPGKLNTQADALSRPQTFPSYNDIFAIYPEMRSLPAYRPPRPLISAINACLWKKSTRATLNAATEPLFSSRLSSFRLGAKAWASKTLH